MKTLLISLTFLIVIGNSVWPCLAESVGSHPNIIVILADDFGVGDIQTHYFKNTIPTPNLDRLVREGLSKFRKGLVPLGGGIETDSESLKHCQFSSSADRYKENG